MSVCSPVNRRSTFAETFALTAVSPASTFRIAGDEPFVSVHWAGFRSWVPERSGERVLLTLLFTDIVGSTERAVAIGDTAWREALAAHYRSIRPILDRYRGREVATTGDGLLAAFDGAGRAIEAALAGDPVVEETPVEGVTPIAPGQARYPRPFKVLPAARLRPGDMGSW